MERTCSIITIFDPNPNYGNRLQNYAVQRVLQDMHLKVSTVVFEKNGLTQLQKIKLVIQRITGYKLFGDTLYWQCNAEQVNKFYKWNTKFINTKEIANIEDIPNVDYYVVGSDQVWNPTWWDTDMKKQMYLLTFASDSKKVCFSPSFGISMLPLQWRCIFEQNLKRFPYISVRENEGQKIVEELTGREATVLIDPTMMLNANEWSKLSRKPKGVDCKCKYILTYFLGGRSTAINCDLKRYSGEIDAKVYNMLDQSSVHLYATDPSNFIYLIKHAELVVTDSFHACVFSFLFDKPFLVYDRQGVETKMMSRINTFLDKFKLQRKYKNCGLANELLEHDYSDGKAVLQGERKKVASFLNQAMKNEMIIT